MTTMNLHTNSKARAAIAAAIARAQKAAKTTLSATELRSIELATLRDIAKRELAAKNSAVSLAAKVKADAERIAKLQARAKYEHKQRMRDAVTIEYAAIFSSVTGGTDSQAYCRKVVHTVHETVSRTIAVCEAKTEAFLREIAASAVPAVTGTIADAKSKAWRTIDKLVAAAKSALQAGKATLCTLKNGDTITTDGAKVYRVSAGQYRTIFADGIAVRDIAGLARYLTAI